MLISEILNTIEYKSTIKDIDIKRVTSRPDLIEKDTLFVFIMGYNYVTLPGVDLQPGKWEGNRGRIPLDRL